MCGRSRATCPRAIPTGNWLRPKPGNDRERGTLGTRHARCIRRAATVALAVVVQLAAPLRAEDADEVTDPAPEIVGPLQIPDSQIEVVDWGDLDGWADDDHEAAFAGFLGSCRALVNSAKSTR